MTAEPEPERQRAVLAAARIRGCYPGWQVRPVRVHGGWRVEALPARDRGCPTVVIGAAGDVEAVIIETERNRPDGPVREEP